MSRELAVAATTRLKRFTRSHRDEPLIRRNADLSVTASDADTRTVSTIWSTGAPVRRRAADGTHYWERLSLDPAHVRLSQIENGPLINGHNHQGIHNLFGVIRNVKVDGQRGTCDMTFSTRQDVEPYYQDVRAGIIRQVSVGYAVEKWETSRNEAGELVRTAVDWTPREISLVGVAADPGAVIQRDHPTLPPEMPNPPVDPGDRALVNGQIRELARAAGLDQAWVDGLIDRGATGEEAKSAVADALVARGSPSLRTQDRPRVEMGYSNDDPEVRCSRMGEALFCRLYAEQPVGPATQYSGISTVDMAREMLRLRGHGVQYQVPSTAVREALHTTSDFPVIFAETMNRTLRREFEGARSVLRQVARQTTVRDFREKTTVDLSGMQELKKINEHGEYQYSTLTEASEKYAIATYGRSLGITRQMLINDDLGAFRDLSRKAAVAARQTEDGLLVSLLTSNSGAGPLMGDGHALFDATRHGNHVATSGAAPSDTTLSAARLAMRTQTNLQGLRLGITPRTVIVPPDLETAAEKLLTTIQAVQTSQVNPWSNLRLLVENRFTNESAWYVVADTSEFDGLEYAYLEGQVGPQVETGQPFDFDGIRIKVWVDFGAGFLDWRGWYRNAGA